MNSNTSAPRVKAGDMAVIIGPTDPHPEIRGKVIEVIELASNGEVKVDGYWYPPARDPTQRFWVVKAEGDPSFYNMCDSSYGIVAENALLPIGGVGVMDLVAAERETEDCC